MQSVDYNYYKGVFFGVSIPEIFFNGMELKARVFVNQYIGENDREGYEDEIKSATCAVAEIIYQDFVRDGKSSENTDGYSVSFDTAKSLSEKAYVAARPYLIHTGMLYKGV